MEKIQIKYLSSQIDKLRCIDGKSDWIDLRAAERVELKAGEFRLIPLGVAMQLPKGYEAHILPRSSTEIYTLSLHDALPISAWLTKVTAATATNGFFPLTPCGIR